MEVVRDKARQLHHRLLDREPRSDGRAYRQFDHRRAGADADRQGIPDHARRLDRGAARDRGGDRRLQRAVRRQPGGRPPGHHRDEPARVALVRARLQGDRIPDRQSRRQARGRLHARRDRQRHHRRRDAGLVRADHRLRRHQDPALRVREISRRRAGADHVDEIGRRGDGDRPHVPGVAAEGAALAGDRAHRPRRDRRSRGSARATTRTPCARRSARPRRIASSRSRRRCVSACPTNRSTTSLQDRSLVPRPDPRHRRYRSARSRARDCRRRPAPCAASRRWAFPMRGSAS